MACLRVLRYRALLGLAITVATLLNCARVEAPPGGPPDKTAPYVAGVYPAPGATQVPRDAILRVQFSEWIQPDAAAGKVVVSPTVAGKMTVTAGPNELAIQFDSLLEANTTYRIWVAPSIKDMAGLHLDSAFSLLFSTGPHLDSGTYSARVVSAEGVPLSHPMLLAYTENRNFILARRGEKRRSHWPDSLLNAWREKPRYSIPCDSLGYCRLEGLAEGSYAWLGLEDANQNGLPDIGESFATGARSQRISSLAVKGRDQKSALLWVAPSDTTPLRLTKVSWFSGDRRGDSISGALKLQFNKPPSLVSGQEVGHYQLAGDSTGTQALSKISLNTLKVNFATDGSVDLSLHHLPIGKKIRLQLSGLMDGAGNGLDTAYAHATFITNTVRDTAKPIWKLNLPAEKESLPREWVTLSMPWPKEVWLCHSTLLTDSLMQSLSQQLRVQADSQKVGALIEKKGAYCVSISMEALKVPAKSLRFSLLQPQKDSLSRTVSGSPNEVALGSIALQTVSDWGKAEFKTHGLEGWRLRLRRVNSAEKIEKVIPRSNTLVLDSLVAGAWRVSAYRDRNQDEQWSAGRLYPWLPQETVVNLSDTVMVKVGVSAGPFVLEAP